MKKPGKIDMCGSLKFYIYSKLGPNKSNFHTLAVLNVLVVSELTFLSFVQPPSNKIVLSSILKVVKKHSGLGILI